MPDVQADFREGWGRWYIIADAQWIIGKAKECHKEVYASLIIESSSRTCLKKWEIQKIWTAVLHRDRAVLDLCLCHLSHGCLALVLHSPNNLPQKTLFVRQKPKNENSLKFLYDRQDIKQTDIYISIILLRWQNCQQFI